MRSSKFLIILLLLISPLVSYSQDHVIKNQSDRPWIIVNSSGGYDIRFDRLSPDVEGACTPGSRLDKGCILPPGKTTFVSYPHVQGELIFTDAVSTFIVVTYKPNSGGIGMKSSNEAKINDKHGDITIFAKK